MKLKDKISEQLKDALKAKDETRVTTLRLLSDALHKEEIDLPRRQAGKKELTKEDEVQIVQRQIKQRKESIDAYKKGNREDLVKREKSELKILKEFLPKQLGREELEKIVEEAIKETGASSASDMGKVIGIIMAEVKGQADGNTIANVVRDKLNK